MNRSHLVAVAATVTVLGGAAFVRMAGAQSAPDPASPGMVCGGKAVGSGLVVQTTEGAGFVGACLGMAITYQPVLPTVCYTPTTADGDAQADMPAAAVTLGPTTCTIPASQVALSYSVLPASYDSYRVLMTCYAHAPGQCPSGSFAISRSCCDLGTNMVSVDGKTASGVATLPL